MNPKSQDRRDFICGSDARIIMGADESALVRLWREKRGEIEPEDLSGNLVVQLGVVTEPLNRSWYERNTGSGGALDILRPGCDFRLVHMFCVRHVY
jgi:predicted phage-related endonuclease